MAAGKKPNILLPILISVEINVLVHLNLLGKRSQKDQRKFIEERDPIKSRWRGFQTLNSIRN